MEEIKIKHSGRIGQTMIYLGKLFRMFIFQSDWKVMPMAAIIAAVVSYVVSKDMNANMEGTLKGAFAFSCVCIWNGFFNSIQVICRERPIVKREHRSGLHMSSYIAAHMIYQAFLCICQSIITLAVLHYTHVTFPGPSQITGNVMVDVGITMFLITYAADMISLFVSSIVHTTTAAMTFVPFLMIFQLIFSGGFFQIPESALFITDLTVSKWGLNAICAQGHYNELPMVSIWNSLEKMRGVEIEDGLAPVDDFLEMMNDDPEKKEQFLMKCSENNQLEKYSSDPDNIMDCWGNLIGYIVLFSFLSMISLEFIDRDRR